MNILTTIQSSEVIVAPTMTDLAKVADHFAKQSVFKRELSGKSENTRIAYQTA